MPFYLSRVSQQWHSGLYSLYTTSLNTMKKTTSSLRCSTMWFWSSRAGVNGRRSTGKEGMRSLLARIELSQYPGPEDLLQSQYGFPDISLMEDNEVLDPDDYQYLYSEPYDEQTKITDNDNDPPGTLHHSAKGTEQVRFDGGLMANGGHAQVGTDRG